MKPLIYIDGSEGTTGLQIYSRLENRTDIELITIDADKRKDVSERKRLINGADIVFLCLPDQAAREAVGMLENPKTRVIDASTAHRTSRGWVYGFPELNKTQREKIASARFAANPGCHATGVISIAAPLVAMGILPPDYPLCVHSLTGYSGGGKSMIADYESAGRPGGHSSPRLYATSQEHRHLAEIVAVSGLASPPVFCPIVADYYAGMATTVHLHNRLLTGSPTSQQLHEALRGYYAGERFIEVLPFSEDPEFLASNVNVGTNNLHVTVSGNGGRTVVTSRFDNLGKGASGSAVQNMNIMLGFDEAAGL